MKMKTPLHNQSSEIKYILLTLNSWFVDSSIRIVWKPISPVAPIFYWIFCWNCTTIVSCSSQSTTIVQNDWQNDPTKEIDQSLDQIVI